MALASVAWFCLATLLASYRNRLMKKAVAAIAVLLIASLGYIGYQRGTPPLVSVVMLTYQRADILPRAIDSILSQNFSDFELIIVNDGSVDGTAQVIKKYADSRIRYYENAANQGIAYSRNRAAALARGKYIMIMDDDDKSLPGRIEKQVSYLEAHPEITALAGQIAGLPRIPASHDEIAAGLIQYNNFGNANIMYRRDFALRHNILYNENYKASEDWDFWLAMLFNGAKFASLSTDVLERGMASAKHYGVSYEEANMPIRQTISYFFAPQNPAAFERADACAKLRMIAPKNIFSPAFMQQLLVVNCPQP